MPFSIQSGVFSENRKESVIPSFSEAAEIMGRLGEELAFVAPDQDTGLLPINGFVMDLEELAEADVPLPLTAGLQVARAWLDEALDGPGKFTGETIRNFNEWHAWMASVLLAWQTGTAMPAWPEGWAPTEKAALATETDRSAATFVPSGAGEPSIRLNLAEDLGLLREFHGEFVELLQGIEQGVLVLEENPADAATIDSIFRAFHTLKGAAGFLRLDALRDLAHDLESLLDAVRCSQLRITSEIIDLILAGADALKHFTREIGSQLQGTTAGAPILVPTRQIIARVRSSLRGEPPEAADSLEGVERSQTAGGSSARLAKTSELAAERKVRQSAVVALRELTTPSPSSGFVKLDTAKLDNLVDLVGELVIAHSMVVQNPDVQKINSLQLVRCLRQLSRITTELQRNAMSLRMVPIRAMFNKMNRLVRDLAAQQRKQVQLVLEGEETELDRNIVEKLSDPLVHMIRNAVDHGLEHPADRVAQGKPELGTIRLTAAHQRGGIVIRIQDDGKGLDRGRILAKAIDSGLVKANADSTEFGDLLANLPTWVLYGGKRHGSIRSWRWYGCRRAQHREPAWEGRDPIATWTGHDLHHPASFDPCHYRRFAGRSRRRSLYHSHALRPRVLQTSARHGNKRPWAGRGGQRAGPADATATLGPVPRDGFTGNQARGRHHRRGRIRRRRPGPARG